MMLGPPDRLLPRGIEAVTADISTSPTCCSFHFPTFPECAQTPTALPGNRKGRRSRSGTTPAAYAATFRTIGAARLLTSITGSRCAVAGPFW